MKKLTIIWLFLSLPFLGISQKVVVPWKINISDTQSYEEALEKALGDAKEEALRMAGVRENIHSFTSLSVLEDNESFEEIFNSEIFSNITGTITRWDYLEGPTKGYDAKLNSPTISFTIEARVKKYKTYKDPSFKAKVQGIKSAYKNGEDIDFNVRFYQDSYINIFYISSEESLILYPTDEDERFANKSYNRNDIKRFNDWYATANTKLSVEYGKFLIVITKEYYPYINNSKKNEDSYSTQTEVGSIMQWLFSIEPKNRDEYYYEFIVSKN
ncbi:hypothetical protein OAJ65_01595 [Flavobacteriales bacterium]|nr:hypothetical protein [Flavobacteriales bacterium]